MQKSVWSKLFHGSNKLHGVKLTNAVINLAKVSGVDVLEAVPEANHEYPNSSHFFGEDVHFEDFAPGGFSNFKDIYSNYGKIYHKAHIPVFLHNEALIQSCPELKVVAEKKLWKIPERMAQFNHSNIQS